ncbi:MAG: hypothetical protein ACOCUW_00435 [Gemmatimonadota bacterium]
MVPALVLALVPVAAEGQETEAEAEAAVKAVLFFSPSCPHCGEVINVSVPELLERYGDRLQVVGVNTASQGGQELYRATIDELEIPQERIGVPTLVVGSQALVGSWEIPNLLPAIVDSALAAGGLD